MELEKCDMKDVRTDGLYFLILKYLETLKAVSTEIVFTVQEDKDLEAMLGEFNRVTSWKDNPRLGHFY